MSLRTFILGLTASFGVAWLAIIVIPFFKMRNLAPVAFPDSDKTAGVYFPKRTGRVANGARVYAENGCYLCHTQVVRPTYAGNDLYRPDWGGLKADPDRGDTRRETNAYDFIGEEFAQIGEMRIGPDLSNLGKRVEQENVAGKDAAAWLYKRLYNPRSNPKLWQSTCPPHAFLFDTVAVKGAVPPDSIAIEGDVAHVLVPNSDAKALVSYLLSMKKDEAVPPSLNFAPGKKD